MSNTPSSRVVLRIQPSALIFAVMILAFGALLLTSSNMDPRVGERPKLTATPTLTPMPIDIFANVKYTAWKSQDSIFQFEHPDRWTVQRSPNAQLAYALLGQDGQNAPISFTLLTTSQLVQQLGAPANLSANSTPEQLLTVALAPQQPGQTPVQIRASQAGELKGASAHFADAGQDPSTGQPVSVDIEVWLLAVDPTHLMLIQGQSRTADWPKLQPIFNHLTETLKVDTTAAIKILDATPTPVATAAATAAATSAR